MNQELDKLLDELYSEGESSTRIASNAEADQAEKSTAAIRAKIHALAAPRLAETLLGAIGSEEQSITWEEKLREMRDDLEHMVNECNADEQYDAGMACQLALQHVARLNDHIEFLLDEKEWDRK